MVFTPVGRSGHTHARLLQVIVSEAYGVPGMCGQIIRGPPELRNETKMCHQNSPKIDIPCLLTARVLGNLLL